MTPKSPNDFLILILSYGRPDFMATHTWGLLDTCNCKARKVVCLSDDDPTIDEYKKLCGDENVFIYSKIESEKKYDIDLLDCYWGKSLSRKATVWGRNEQFRMARELGYRWFIVLDDDYIGVSFRRPMARKGSDKPFFPVFKEDMVAQMDGDMSVFDHCCIKCFELLDSAPWMYAVGLPQAGDFLGGAESKVFKRSWIWKAMNVFFCDTHKEYRYYGRFNDDVNAYVLNGKRGQMSLTLTHAPSINQPSTQSVKGGVTDLYRMFGTYVKSLTSAVANPGAVTVGVMGNITPRVHHHIHWDISAPMVVPDTCCKEKPLDYCKECLHDVSFTPDPNRTTTFLDPDAAPPENCCLTSNAIENFF